MEEWRPIKGYESFYEISSFGRIKSLPRFTEGAKPLKIKERIMKLRVRPDGYLSVNLSKESKSKTFRVNRLVALNFINEYIPQGLEVCHNDGVRSNNRVSNLRIDTHLNNENDKIIHGTHLGAVGENNYNCKLSDLQCEVIRKSKEKLSTLSQRYNVSESTISRIRNNKRRKQATPLLLTN